MSTPLDQPPPQQVQPPPPQDVTQQAYTAHSGRGSVGPLIAVLAVITILGIIAGIIGRLCSGRGILGYGQYDVEGWLERKCSTCLDGGVDPTRQPVYRPRTEEPTVAVQVQEPETEIKEEEEATQEHKQHESSGS